MIHAGGKRSCNILAMEEGHGSALDPSRRRRAAHDGAKTAQAGGLSISCRTVQMAPERRGRLSMFVKYRRNWCANDRKFVLAQSKRPHHFLHGLVSLGTAGLWLPIWLVLTLKTDTRFLCPECGGPTGPRPRSGKRRTNTSSTDDDA